MIRKSLHSELVLVVGPEEGLGVDEGGRILLLSDPPTYEELVDLIHLIHYGSENYESVSNLALRNMVDELWSARWRPEEDEADTTPASAPCDVSFCDLRLGHEGEHMSGYDPSWPVSL